MSRQHCLELCAVASDSDTACLNIKAECLKLFDKCWVCWCLCQGLGHPSLTYHCPQHLDCLGHSQRVLSWTALEVRDLGGWSGGSGGSTGWRSTRNGSETEIHGVEVHKEWVWDVVGAVYVGVLIRAVHHYRINSLRQVAYSIFLNIVKSGNSIFFCVNFSVLYLVTICNEYMQVLHERLPWTGL